MIKREDALSHMLQVSAAGLGLALIIFCLLLCNRGFDLTDEGYYFNWISNPWLYQYYASQFGYIYHPIYKALGNSIVHLRQANMLISFGLSWLLSDVLIKQYFQDISKVNRVLLSACLALPALYILMIMGRWVPTPSYNSLNFQGCLLAALGFVYSLKQVNNYRYLAMLLIGVGGWLVFMAKPSTALLLGLVTLLFYLPNIKKDGRFLGGAAITAILMLVFSAWWIDGSIPQFIKRYQGGFMLIQTMGGGHGLNNLLRFDWFKTTALFKLQFAVVTLLIMLAFKMASLNATASKILSLCMLLILAYTANSLFNIEIETSQTIAGYHTLMIVTVGVAALLYSAFTSGNDKIAAQDIKKLQYLLLVLPYVYAAGSSNNYWQTAAGASVFWVLATILFLIGHRRRSEYMHVIAIFCVVSVTFGIKHAMQAPYRQSQSILAQKAEYIDARNNTSLKLSDDTANYLNALTSIANTAKFKPDTPVIDLTGHHPGSLYLMGAKAIGQAWTIGGYAGSQTQAAIALYQASCEEIASAWLLIEKDGRRAISESVLMQHGITANKQTYRVVGQLQTQQLTDWGAKNPQHSQGVYTQYLVQPVDIENQTRACLASRSVQPSPL